MADLNSTAVSGKRSLRARLADLLGPGLRRAVAVRLSARSLRAARGRCRSVSDLCRLTFEWRGYGGCWSIRSLQDITEMVPFFEAVKARQPRVCMEIGTCHGGTLFTLMALAPDDAHIISVDLPGGIHGGGSTDIHAEMFRAAFPTGQQRLDLIRDDSHQVATRDQARTLLAGKQLDYLFIDGDHRYEGVKKDFLLYASLVRPGGMIAFHDISDQTQTGVEVNRLWAEIKPLIPTTEYLNPAKNSGLLVAGIGVIPSWEPKVLEAFE